MTKYRLKPGKHQFALGSHAVHDNDSLTDEDAEWYLERYPHIITLFTPQPLHRSSLVPEGEAINQKKDIMKNKTTSKKKTKEVSLLTPPSGGKGGI